VVRTPGHEKSYLKLDGSPKLQAASWIRVEVAKSRRGGGAGSGQAVEQAQSREFNPIELPVHLQARVASQLRPFVSRNVLAALLGGIDTKRGSHIVHGALRHLGIDPDKKDHNIYNGAVDNATGAAYSWNCTRVSQMTSSAPPRQFCLRQ